MDTSISKCSVCGSEFHKKNKGQKYCSRGCSLKNFVNCRKSERIDKICEVCGSSYLVTQSRKNTKYCSNTCRYRGSVIIKTKGSWEKCYNNFCDELVYRPRFKKEKFDRAFCSMKCLNIYRSQCASERKKYINTKPEQEFAKILRKHKINFKPQYWVNWKRGWKKFYDFCLLDYKILIEIDGVYWHGKDLLDEELNLQQSHTRKNDVIKNKLAMDSGYILIRIWEDEIDENFIINLLNLYQ